MTITMGNLYLYQPVFSRFRIVAAFVNDDNKEGQTSRKFTLDLAPEFRPKAPKNQPRIIKSRPVSRSQIAIEWQVGKLS